LMHVAAKAPDFEVWAGIQRLAQALAMLCWSVDGQHSLIPCLAGVAVGLLARLCRALGGSSNRGPVNGFARLRANWHIKARSDRERKPLAIAAFLLGL